MVLEVNLTDKQIAKYTEREGNKSMMYKCPAGKNTIGFGHNLDAKGLSQRARLVILEDDLNDAKRDLLAHLPWASGLAPARIEALTDMVFNMGVGALKQFKNFLAAVQAGDWQAAVKHGKDSDWYRQVGKRAREVLRQIETGEE
jgi:lysozyme